MTGRDTPRGGDVLLFLVAMFLGLTLIGQMDDLHQLNTENERLRARADQCRLALAISAGPTPAREVQP